MTRKKSYRTPHLTDEDRALWKASTAVITPHKKTDTHRKKRTLKEEDVVSAPLEKTIAKTVPKNKWQPLAHKPLSKAAPKRATAPADRLADIAPDIFKSIEHKKRGIDARLDLHGLTQDAAHRKALSFIQRAYAQKHKTVLIITGKGKSAVAVAPLGAEQSHHSILQKNLPRWLDADPATARMIAGITQAPAHLGGAGAYVIMLKKQR
ncbi:MAG: hypothetical protein EB059_06435 [Alphaproteobacteria bacterium]|nr:hypothetical protein [Alphaproteobacteria bacterium]